MTLPRISLPFACLAIFTLLLSLRFGLYGVSVPALFLAVVFAALLGGRIAAASAIGNGVSLGFVEKHQVEIAVEEQRVIAQVWSHDGPYFATPAGHWNHFAQQVSRRDGHGLDQDVKLFLVLNGALLDAGIVAWDAKVAYDSVRPITAIRMLFAGQIVRGWRGRDQGFGPIRGDA